jgi:hypothetical protein
VDNAYVKASSVRWKERRDEERVMGTRFTINLLCLIFIVARVAAQTAPPRKDIPTIAKTANGAILSIIMSDKDGHNVAQGTGFLISKEGSVVTNYHVIENGSSAIVKLPDGAFYIVDGVLASDKLRDIAVIKVHGENFRTLTLGNSDRLEVGEEVVAIGNPLSLESTVSNGIVSGIRTAEEKGGKFLQVTTPISPGSSGGPLFNMAGEVVGITTSYLEGGENLNFAIPINDAKRLLLPKSSKIHALPNEAGPDIDLSAGLEPKSPVAMHAPSVAQCQADARAWGFGPRAVGEWLDFKLRFTVGELQIMSEEMLVCSKVNPQDDVEFSKRIEYYDAYEKFYSLILERKSSFIKRHHLDAQFVAEDAAGER